MKTGNLNSILVGVGSGVLMALVVLTMIRRSMIPAGLLTLLVQNRDKVMKKEYLFNSVWGSDSDSEMQTLHVHINRLRQKLGDDPKNAKRLLTVWGVGYKFV